MISKRHITHEMVEQARQMDLYSYLRATDPGNLVRCGANEFCTKEHDSLKISNGMWYWWSHGIGGASALDYLVKVEGMDFLDAVTTVLNRSGYVPKEPFFKQEKPKEIYLPPYDFGCDTVKKYLMSRGIDEEIIKDFIQRRMIAEEKGNRYALFFGLDENGKVRQCSGRATDGTHEKKDAAGSDRSYSFQIANENCDTLRVFESAIDLLSFATLMKREGFDYKSQNLLSLSGVYLPKENMKETKIPASVRRFLDSHPNIKTVCLHLDNDFAGKRGAAGFQCVLRENYDVPFLPPPYGKDFNDYILHLKNLEKIQNEKENHNEKEQSR